MRLLLDTHIALWAILDDARLPAAARDLITDPANEIVVSVATLWEIATKHALARGRANDMPISGQQAQRYFQESGYETLDIQPPHVVAVEALPPLHADPFDRILVAQALSLPLRLITHDPKLAAYSDIVLLV